MEDLVVLCGGRSVEHEVSLISVGAVLRNLSPERYRVAVLGIGKDGRTLSAAELRARLPVEAPAWVVLPETRHWLEYLVARASDPLVVFPVLHGPYGEDGTVQGALEVLDLAYVGASVGGSAVGMNKIYCKAILSCAGLPVVPWIDFEVDEWSRNREGIRLRVERELEYPVFVKPACLGSSVGISRCRNADELVKAVDFGLQFDDRVVVERAVNARELEVSVLGSFSPRASAPGEIVPSDVFYTYEAKYLNGTSELLIPAPLEGCKVEEIRNLAVRTFTALQFEGMARVDFLMDRTTGKLWINEPNTIPGFTQISMYPKLWEYSGLAFPDLLVELIELARLRHRRRARLRVER